MRSISIGDKVIIHMNTTSFFGSCDLQAVVDYVPCDTGDSWYFTGDAIGMNGQYKFLINPNCSQFIGIELAEVA